jgi:hypothetical protein
MDRIELLSRPFPVRLVWVGPLTVVTSIAVVLVVRIAAVALLRPPPEFTPLGWDSPIVLTGAPGATWPNALALMLMHVAAWAVSTWMLTRLTVGDRG